MIRMMVAIEEEGEGGMPSCRGGATATRGQDNSGRSSNTYFLSSSRLRQTTQNYKKMFTIDDLGAAKLTNFDSNLESEIVEISRMLHTT